jgi:hypothetical protein
VVTWPEPSDEPEPAGLHWKTRTLVDWAADRPFAWLDDEITDADRAWAKAHHPARTFLHRVDHRYGITDADFAALETWFRNGSRSSPSRHQDHRADVSGYRYVSAW